MKFDETAPTSLEYTDATVTVPRTVDEEVVQVALDIPDVFHLNYPGNGDMK